MLTLPANIILMLIGKVMIDTGPGEINKFMGYRTKKSMLNQKNWEIGQKFSAYYMYKIFAVLLPFSIPFIIIDILSLFEILKDFWFIFSLIIQTALILIGLSLIFYFTEKQLKMAMNDEEK